MTWARWTSSRPWAAPCASVPNQALPPLLAGYKDTSKYPQIGSLFEPDYEKIEPSSPT